jgi:hypothetical protein
VPSQSAPLPSLFRFAGRDSTTGTDDLATLLQSRLLVIAMVIGITFVVFFLLLTTRIGAADAVTAASMARGRIVLAIAIPPSLGCAWWLRQRPHWIVCCSAVSPSKRLTAMRARPILKRRW